MARFLSLVVFLFLLSDSGDRYRIVSLSSADILIGTERKVRGDDFGGSETIHWETDNQVMRVIDIETEEMFLFAKSVTDVTKKRSLADYRQIVSSLSTDMSAVTTKKGDGGYYYISFMADGRESKVKLNRGMSMAEYPFDISLHFFNPKSGSDELLTTDFRDFLDDLIITDDMVKRQMSGVEYFKGEEKIAKEDYMVLMHTYVDEEYSHIVYTYEDLKLFLTLRY